MTTAQDLARLEKQRKLAAIFDDDATGAGKSGDLTAVQPSPSGDSSNSRRRPSITTSKGALEPLTKGRITSNLTIYKPRELRKVRFSCSLCMS